MVVQKPFKEARIKARVVKLAGCHTLRHSFATRLLEDGYDYQNGPEAPRSQRRQHDDDLHACLESRWERSPSPADGLTVAPGPGRVYYAIADLDLNIDTVLEMLNKAPDTKYNQAVL